MTRTTSELGYDKTWQRISRADRERQPWCSFCHAAEGEEYMDERGVIRKVRLTVDHITPLSQGGDSRASNRRVLCAACHGQLTGAARWA